MCSKLSLCVRDWSKQFAHINSFNPYTNSVMSVLLLSPFQRCAHSNRNKYTLCSYVAEAKFTNPSILTLAASAGLTSNPVPGIRPWTRSGQPEHFVYPPPSVTDLERDVSAKLGRSCSINANPGSYP